MTDERTVFQRLGNDNYAEWAMRMEAVLTKRGLWSMVEVLVSRFNADGSEKTENEITAERVVKIAKRDVEKMAEARAELILRVEDGQLSHMTSRDPLVVWENLQRMHRAAGFATSLALRRKFLTSKKTDNETMEAWIGRIQTMVLRMEHADVVVTDQDKILAFTMGLPPSYDPVIINFDATPPDQLSVEHVISRLLNEETRQLSSATPAAPTDPIDEAMAVTTARQTPTAAACFFCDKKGHFKSNCPEKLAWETAKKKRGVDAGGTSAAVEFDSDSEGAW